MTSPSNAAQTAAREAARRRSGQFGEQNHTAPELTLGDLSTHTPVDIDERLAEIYKERDRARQLLSWRQDEVDRALKDQARAQERGERYEGQLEYHQELVDAAEAKVAEQREVLECLKADAAPYEEEFRARGGWRRIFLAASANGHAHASMDCSTCNRDGKLTEFAWLTEYSGASDEEIITDAGERACSTCWPDAPVSALNRPTKMFSPDEKRKQQERIEREAAKVERDRKRIENGLTDDGSEFVVYPEPADSGRRQYGERFKTERAAVIWATDHLGWFKAGDHQPDRQESQAAAVRQIAEAIAKKHGRPVEYVLGELQVKAELKMKDITKKTADQRIAALAEKYGVS